MSRRFGPHLWPRGRTPEIVMDAARVGLEGWFTVSLIHARSGLIMRELRFRNLITDVGLDLIGAGTAGGMANFLTHFAVGTSSVAPATTQTTLGAEAGRTNSNGGFNDTASTWISGNAYIFARRTRVFTEAQANGNLTEVGIFNAATGGTMFCRSLLKDANGAATTITKTSEFQLRIDYEIRLYPPNAWADYTFDAPVNGTLRTMTARPLATGSGSAWNVLLFGDAPSTSSGANPNDGAFFSALAIDTALRSASSIASFNEASTAKVNTAYAAGSYYREQTQDWGGAVANDTNYFLWGWSGLRTTFQVLFPVAFTKNNTQKFVIVARAHWARRP